MKKTRILRLLQPLNFSFCFCGWPDAGGCSKKTERETMLRGKRMLERC